MNPLALFSSAKAVAIGVIIVALLAVIGGFWWNYAALQAKARDQAATIATQGLQLDEAQQANQQAAAALATQKALHDRDMAAITADAAAARASRDRLAKLQRETLNAPASDYVPISAGARRDLGRLRDSAAPPAGQPDGRARDGAGAAAGVRAEPAAADR